jgi:pimeloyl-ACP methyl ester carboxylesterase
LYTHFLFFPKKEIKSEPQQICGFLRQNVVIPVEGGDMHGWFFENSKSPYVVLVNHGNGGNVSSVQWIANNLLSAGVSVLVYDYRGYGQSKGNPTVESICSDGDAAYEFLIRDKGYHPEHVILYGQSLGCAVACHVSNNHRAAALILQSGFASLRHVAFEHFPLLRRAPALVPNALDNEEILSHSSLPVLFIHGDKDRVVPFDNAEDLYKSATGAKRLVVCPNAGHNLYPDAVALHRQAVHDFIQEVITNKTAERDREAELPTPSFAVTEAGQSTAL